MAFLSKKLMAKSEKASGRETHPLLKGREVSQSVRLAYLQGCVLATLLDDAQVSADERRQIEDVGRSLGIDDVEIEKSLEVVQGLQSDEDQDAFLKELKAALGEKDVIALFMADFERLMQKSGGISSEAKNGLDFIGEVLVGVPNWREELLDWKEKREHALVAEAAAEAKRKKSVIRANTMAFYEKAMEFIATLKPVKFDKYDFDHAWTGKETVRRFRDKVRKYVSGLSLLDVNIEDVWNYHLEEIKRRYIEDRPEEVCGIIATICQDTSKKVVQFDMELFFESVWFLAILSFVKHLGSDDYSKAIALSDLEWLTSNVTRCENPRSNNFFDVKKENVQNERFIWKLLKVASKTIGTEAPEVDKEAEVAASNMSMFNKVMDADFSAAEFARCKGWWNE